MGSMLVALLLLMSVLSALGVFFSGNRDAYVYVSPRYIVGVPGKRLAYKGGSRLMACLFWLALVKSGGEAYGRHALLMKPKYWIPRRIFLGPISHLSMKVKPNERRQRSSGRYHPA